MTILERWPYYSGDGKPRFYDTCRPSNILINKAEDLPPFEKKTRNIFMLGKYSDIFSADDTE